MGCASSIASRTSHAPVRISTRSPKHHDQTNASAPTLDSPYSPRPSDHATVTWFHTSHPITSPPIDTEDARNFFDHYGEKQELMFHHQVEALARDCIGYYQMQLEEMVKSQYPEFNTEQISEMVESRLLYSLPGYRPHQRLMKCTTYFLHGLDPMRTGAISCETFVKTFPALHTALFTLLPDDADDIRIEQRLSLLRSIQLRETYEEQDKRMQNRPATPRRLKMRRPSVETQSPTSPHTLRDQITAISSTLPTLREQMYNPILPHMEPILYHECYKHPEMWMSPFIWQHHLEHVFLWYVYKSDYKYHIPTEPPTCLPTSQPLSITRQGLLSMSHDCVTYYLKELRQQLIDKMSTHDESILDARIQRELSGHLPGTTIPECIARVHAYWCELIRINDAVSWRTFSSRFAKMYAALFQIVSIYDRGQRHLAKPKYALIQRLRTIPIHTNEIASRTRADSEPEMTSSATSSMKSSRRSSLRLSLPGSGLTSPTLSWRTTSSTSNVMTPETNDTMISPLPTSRQLERRATLQRQAGVLQLKIGIQSDDKNEKEDGD